MKLRREQEQRIEQRLERRLRRIEQQLHDILLILGDREQSLQQTLYQDQRNDEIVFREIFREWAEERQDYYQELTSQEAANDSTIIDRDS